MTDIVSVTGPIFLLIALGFATARGGVLGPGEFAALGKYVVNLALPALLFRALAARPLAETVDAPYMAAYALAGLVLVGSGYQFLRRVRRESETGAAIGAMGMACPNSGFVGYPIVLLAFPDLAGTVLALNFAVENLVIIPLLLVLAERGRHAGGSAFAALGPVLAGLVRSPLMIALAAGAAWSLSGLAFPDALAKPVDMLAASSGAASLIVIGGALARARLAGIGGAALPVAVGKLALHPALVALAIAGLSAAGFGIADARMRTALLISAAMPIMGIYPLLAMRHGLEERASIALVATTALSFVSVNILFALMDLLAD